MARRWDKPGPAGTLRDKTAARGTRRDRGIRAENSRIGPKTGGHFRAAENGCIPDRTPEAGFRGGTLWIAETPRKARFAQRNRRPFRRQGDTSATPRNPASFPGWATKAKCPPKKVLAPVRPHPKRRPPVAPSGVVLRDEGELAAPVARGGRWEACAATATVGHLASRWSHARQHWDHGPRAHLWASSPQPRHGAGGFWWARGRGLDGALRSAAAEGPASSPELRS